MKPHPTVEPTQPTPEYNTTQVVLNGGQHTSLTARDGSFAFRDVTAGVYLLEVLSPDVHYSSMKVKVDDKTGIIAIEYKVPATPHLIQMPRRCFVCTPFPCYVP